MKKIRSQGDFIDGSSVAALLGRTAVPGREHIRDILARARELQGLLPEQVLDLALTADRDLMDEIYETGRFVKEAIYGKRLVLFAPLYISNLCGNECLYCAFRAKNTLLRRRALTQVEIAREVGLLESQGHKRILLVAGEAYPREGFRYVLDSIATIYSVKSDRGEIRRVNVNVAPLTSGEFRELKSAKIGTYQLFQETYHRPTYALVHAGGRKRDYDWRVTALDRAMAAGIDDVGIGVLFGLHDWRFEILALFQHIAHLEKTFGVGPHTISVPRLEPAAGSDLASHPPAPVSDEDFKKIVAILRLAVPYTGIIMSTRETAKMRAETFALGVSQISAGSRTNPGGYAADVFEPEASQFALGDHRPLDEVIRDAARLGYVPSFCTGCYRLGRTGADFMNLAKPGEIKAHCDPNALATFMEYLLDFAGEETRRIGLDLVERTLAGMSGPARTMAEKLVTRTRAGERDVFC